MRAAAPSLGRWATSTNTSLRACFRAASWILAHNRERHAASPADEIAERIVAELYGGGLLAPEAEPLE